MDPATGEAFLAAAGTSKSYPGLWRCVRDAGMIDPAALDAWDAPLPEIAPVDGLASGMSTVDRAFERLALVRDAAWAVPADHPDLVPAALAGQIDQQFRAMADLPEAADASLGRDDEHVRLLRAAAGLAADLEAALATRAIDAARAAAAFARLRASCNDCHASYRDPDAR